MANIHSQFEKALALINNVEEQQPQQQQQHSVLYAKYTIYIKQGDIKAAEAILRALVQVATTPYALALCAVKDYCSSSIPERQQQNQEKGDGSSDMSIKEAVDKSVPATHTKTLFFQLLAQQFPK